jgi:hypothetical protein
MATKGYPVYYWYVTAQRWYAQVSVLSSSFIVFSFDSQIQSQAQQEKKQEFYTWYTHERTILVERSATILKF